MGALSKRGVVAFRKWRIFIILTMALAFPAVAAHEGEKGAVGCAITGAMPAAQVQHLAWHRQQAGLAELDPLTGFLRLFATYADELAAQGASSHEIRSKP